MIRLKNSLLISCLISASVLSFSCSSTSGKSGFILDGKEFVLYKNGKVVRKNRDLASARTSSKVLYFQEDKFARCYYLAPAPNGSNRPLQCIKKQ